MTHNQIRYMNPLRREYIQKYNSINSERRRFYNLQRYYLMKSGTWNKETKKKLADDVNNKFEKKQIAKKKSYKDYLEEWQKRRILPLRSEVCYT